MADEHDAVDEPSWEIVYGEGHAADPADRDPAAQCADCRGTGKILLLITEQPCETCGGTGKADACEAMLFNWGDGDASPRAGSEQAPIIVWNTEYDRDEDGPVTGPFELDVEVEEYGEDPET